MLNVKDLQSSGRFTIYRRLRSGGSWEVYEAHDRERNGLVALKVIPFISDSHVARLHQQVRALAQISHPNIMSLYDIGCKNRLCFITSELIEGVTIIDYVRPASRSGEGRSMLNEDRLRSVLRQLGSAIQALHEKGLVHCDLKPSIVLVTSEARLVLVDFDMLKHISDRPPEQITLPEGTPIYMSPEQVVPRSATSASDWYSVGVMLYEALTGKLPFSGKIFELMANKVNLDPPQPIEVAGGIPEDLNDLCMQLLQRDPRKRANGSEVLDLLERSRTTWQHSS